tara:strand:+ start:490 stop:699 length:210 start_codon:yes stop_codon:yes gene_type:complete
MDIAKKKVIRRYPENEYESVGQFIRKLGGYGHYYKWLRDNPVVSNKKIGRNDKCPCNSGKKYKKCCLNK